MYTDFNFKTKTALKEAVKAGIEVRYYQPGIGSTPMNGVISVEGPHYPEPHRWWARCEVEDGVIVSVK